MADFIITSLQSWDIEIGSTIKNTASEIAKKHRVLYLNPPMDIATRLRIAAGKGPLLQAIDSWKSSKANRLHCGKSMKIYGYWTAPSSYTP